MYCQDSQSNLPFGWNTCLSYDVLPISYKDDSSSSTASIGLTRLNPAAPWGMMLAMGHGYDMADMMHEAWPSTPIYYMLE